MAYSRTLLYNSTALSLLPIRSTELFAISAPEILFSLFVPVTVRPPGSIILSAYSYFYYTIFCFTMQLVRLLIVLNSRFVGFVRCCLSINRSVFRRRRITRLLYVFQGLTTKQMTNKERSDVSWNKGQSGVSW